MYACLGNSDACQGNMGNMTFCPDPRSPVDATHWLGPWWETRTETDDTRQEEEEEEEEEEEA